MRREDVLISHYALHALPVWKLKNKIIVLSHGIEWYPNEKTFNTYLKEKLYKKALDRFTTVANDTNYFRHFGIDIKPGEKFFEEVAPNKWFIPNAVDTSLFKRTQGGAILNN